MLVNPLAPIIEFWLTIFNALPSPFRSFIFLSIGFFLVSGLISIVWRVK